MPKILKRVDVIATYPDGREIRGFSSSYPENTKQVLYQVFDYNEKDSYLINLVLAESIRLNPTFEENK